MYSFAPVVMANDISMAVYLIVVFIGVMWGLWREMVMLPAATVVMVIVAYVFMVDVPRREQQRAEAQQRYIIATRVESFDSVGSVRISKHTRSQVPTMHILYQIPSGEVISFRRYDGHVYPEQVKLYYGER